MEKIARLLPAKVILVMVFVIFGSVSAWAAGVDVTISTTGTVTPNTWSNTAYVGVDGKVTSILADVINSIKTSGETDSNVYGVKYEGSSTLTVGSLADGIAVNSATGAAHGIYASGSGTTTLSGLGGITANGAAHGYGIYSNGTNASFANNVSFKGNGGQAITATAANAVDAYSIYAGGQGATTVTFEDSKLSGKVAQNDTATVTLNFNNDGVWTVDSGDVSGNVSVNMNSGSTLDTRKATGVALNKTINLGTGTIAAQGGSKINFDAKTENIGLTTDQIKAATGAGTIALGTVNVTDTATFEWTTPKSACLFVDASSNPLNVTVVGTTQVIGNGYIYTFTGGSNGYVSVTSEKLTSISVTVGQSGYATVYSTSNLIVPEGVAVLDYKYNIGESYFEKMHGFVAGTVIEGGKGYVVTATPGTYNFTTTTDDATECVSCLSGVTADAEASALGGVVYVFDVVDGIPGFYKFTGKLKAGKAYYPVN